MPTRYLKESICTSETLSLLSAEGERFWYRLLVQVDDFGRMDARTAILRARCFPLMLEKVSETKITSWLAELERAGLLRLYRVEGKPYLEIVTFTRHNQLRAKVSKYPAPNGASAPASNGSAAANPGDLMPALMDAGGTDNTPTDADDWLQLHAGADSAIQPPALADTCIQMQADADKRLQILSESESESRSESIDPGGELDLKSARAHARGSPAPPLTLSFGAVSAPYAVIDLTNAPASLLRLYLDASGERGSPSPRFRKWFEEVTTRYTRGQCEGVFRQLAQDVAAGRTQGSKWRHTQGLFRALDGRIDWDGRSTDGARTGRRAPLARNEPGASVVTATVIEL